MGGHVVAAPVRTSVVHVAGPFEDLVDGVAVRRCAHCRLVLFLRFPGDGEPWHREGDRIRVHVGGLRERTEAAVTCERVAAA